MGHARPDIKYSAVDDLIEKVLGGQSTLPKHALRHRLCNAYMESSDSCVKLGDCEYTRIKIRLNGHYGAGYLTSAPHHPLVIVELLTMEHDQEKYREIEEKELRAKKK